MTVTQESLADLYEKKYPRFFAKNSIEQSDAVSKRFHEAWNMVKAATNLLKERFGATKVVLFGSLTNRERFSDRSDVDIAVWGIPDDQFFLAVGLVNSLNENFKVDLVDANACRTSLRKSIEDEGIEL